MIESIGAPSPEQAAQPEALPPEVDAALLPPLPLEMDSSQPVEEQRFDINVHKVKARDFFMGLVKGTNHNMMIHPDVKGRISLELKNVTIEEVMQVVGQIYGYQYSHNAIGYQVFPGGLQSRLYEVNYLNITRLGSSETRVSSGQITGQENSSNNNSSSSSSSSSSSGSSSNDSSGSSSVSGSRVETRSEFDFWAGMKASLEAIIGGEGRSVVINPQAGVVVVRALPNELREVENYLNSVQQSVERQVLIEAKIIEVTLSDGFQSGINWAALWQPGRNKSITVGQTGGGTLFGGTGASEIAGNTGTLNPGALSPVEGTDTSAFGGLFTLALNLNDFTAFVELLKTQGQVNVLSSPRITTTNNQKAVIKVGSDEFFVTDVSSTTVSGTATTTTPQIELTPFFSGIALDVTPQIKGDGEVILHIHPSVSEVTDQTKQITVGGQSQSLPLALSSVRESDSVVRARNGQVVVLGGLMKNSTRDDDARVPILGDLPGLGRLFSYQKNSSSKSELVILLRPVVVQSGQTWVDTLAETRRSFRKLQRPAVDNGTAPPQEHSGP